MNNNFLIAIYIPTILITFVTGFHNMIFVHEDFASADANHIVLSIVTYGLWIITVVVTALYSGNPTKNGAVITAILLIGLFFGACLPGVITIIFVASLAGLAGLFINATGFSGPSVWVLVVLYGILLLIMWGCIAIKENLMVD